MLAAESLYVEDDEDDEDEAGPGMVGPATTESD